MAITDYSATEADNKTVPGSPAIQLGYGGYSGVTAHQIQTESIQRIMADLKTFHTSMGGIDGLAKTDGNMIVGDGTNWVAESGSTLRASIGCDNATNLTSGTVASARLEARIRDKAVNGTITDWNNAASNGWYREADVTNNANSVSGLTGWMSVYVEAFSASYIQQTAYYPLASATDRKRVFRRHNEGGSWGAWYEITGDLSLLPTLAGANEFTGSSKYTGTADATTRPVFQIIKSDSSLSYESVSYNSPASVLQWSDSTSLGSNANRDAFVHRTDITGDGSVTVNGSFSGGSSTSIWRGAYFACNKEGDGSGHSATVSGELREYGATGYNELGLSVGTGTNTGSRNGTIHGAEYLVRDGTGTVQTSGTAQSGGATTIQLASGDVTTDDEWNGYGINITGGTGSGQWRMISDSVASTDTVTVDTAWTTNPDATSTYAVIRALDTFLVAQLGRTAVYYGASDRKRADAFIASAEGDYDSSSVLFASTESSQSWKKGIDFEGTTFADSHAFSMDETQRVNWTDGTNNSYVTVGATGNFTFSIAGSAFIPSTDNNRTLGSASFRWSEVFAGNGTINTSDETMKQDIGEIPDKVLDAWGEVNWQRFKWKDSVTERGDDARWHSGLIAQEIERVFSAHGLDANQWGVLCINDGEDEDGNPTGGKIYGVRYNEAQAIENAYLRREFKLLKANSA